MVVVLVSVFVVPAGFVDVLPELSTGPVGVLRVRSREPMPCFLAGDFIEGVTNPSVGYWLPRFHIFNHLVQVLFTKEIFDTHIGLLLVVYFLY